MSLPYPLEGHHQNTSSLISEGSVFGDDDDITDDDTSVQDEEDNPTMILSPDTLVNNQRREGRNHKELIINMKSLFVT